MSGWDFPEGFEPLDDHVGPFPLEPFVDSWRSTVGRGDPVSIRSDKAFLPMIEDEGALRVAGDPDLTDYHSALGPDPASLGDLLLEARTEVDRVILDSLPEQSATSLKSGLEAAGGKPQLEQTVTTAVITVEDEYLAELSKKQRHEVRRKRRRFVEALGEPELITSTDDTDALGRFVAMHRTSFGEKAEFFDEGRIAFFESLHASPGWKVSELVVGGEPIASLFGFEGESAYYLYNSAYDSIHREVSPGVVVLHMLIENLVDAGIKRIDLLKGDEIYKFRMGAEARPLHRISI